MYDIMRTDEELTVVRPEVIAPNNIQEERVFRCIRVVEKMDFNEVSIIASLVQPLAATNISMLTIKTFNTVCLFFREENLQKVKATLEESGYSFITAAG